ncbi:MAG: site-specific integrase, partial [Gammaproteobacteria bacterium]|nr:site-specific integrase [Gammaproteobacteria bacterium]
IAGGPTHLGTRRSDATVNRYLSALSSVLTAAVKQWRWLEDSPVSAVRRGREAEPRVRILTRTQRQALLAACRDSEHAE